MSIAQLWKAHWANPTDTNIRAQIALRDPRGIRQLQPIHEGLNPLHSGEVACREFLADIRKVQEDVSRRQ